MQGNAASGERLVVNVEVIWMIPYSPSVYEDERWMDAIEAVSTGSKAETENIYEKNGKESRSYVPSVGYEGLEWLCKESNGSSHQDLNATTSALGSMMSPWHHGSEASASLTTTIEDHKRQYTVKHQWKQYLDASNNQAGFIRSVFVSWWFDFIDTTNACYPSCG